MSLKRELNAVAYSVSGGNKSKVARSLHASRFADFLKKDQNVRIEKIQHVKAKHIKDYAAARLKEGISKRTMQNEIGSLRVILRQSGRHQLASLSEISNKALGIGGASRKGTKTAMPPERVRELAEKIKDPGVKACVFLEQGLGLRAEEARASDLKTLKGWEKNLEKGDGRLYVIRGAKNGRERWVTPADRVRALAAVKSAIRVAEAHPKGYLIGGTLAQSENKYKNQMSRAGFVGKEAGHSLRYAFAKRQYENYKAQGMSERDAIASVSRDLGHGDSRGPYVKNVYLL